MATVFSRIISGELPGRFVYRDDTVVAFLSIGPVAWGHTLVVPVEEVDQWVDASPELWAHLNEVAQLVGRAMVTVTGAARAGYLIAGFEIPHTHIHVFGADDMRGYQLAAIDVSEEEMERAQAELRAALRELGAGDHVPA
ncbi:Diadenosine tetraphosphate (Ap4A) hydrolase [Raineyella antarctica]|uniref:Diadenosine tetraphosphate (Ap4A) hydrolase n=1 Tax=Raineyella antarctica TaxID=1577474 RepID=A0A1G6H7D3_9ACTN|nr:HIT family protein [Raineyella antarctica]SDB90172.1 Diadenosine tetraphosphate (Ap4A) hydrolase [Raineyella antarctica]